MLKRGKLPKDPYLYNGLALAYMGDAVFEIYVRRYLISQGGTKAHTLHVKATQYVSAKAQAKILIKWLDEGYLNERELEIVKRGRNAKSNTVPKHTELKIYRFSTAFESLIGYLYLNEQTERLADLIYNAFEIVEESEVDS